MSGNHTPTPWPDLMDFDFQSDPIAVLQPEIASDNGGFKIAIFYGPDRVANASLAITAVNSYASSQAEIERLKGALQTIASRADGYSHGDDHVTAAFAGIANIALAALSGSKE